MEKNKKILCFLSALFLLFTGYKYYDLHIASNINNKLESPEDTSLKVNKIESNLKIKYLQTSTDSTGREMVSFSYEVLPVEANDKSVTTSLLWSNDSVEEDINEFLSYTHDSKKNEISIVCLQKSNNQAQFILISNANPDATAVIFIDFEQEFLGFADNSISLETHFVMSDSETILGEQEIKEEILSLSQGFLGTISVNEKEISNLNMVLQNVSISLRYNTIDNYITNDPSLNEAYSIARNFNRPLYFINSLGENYISTLENSQKLKLRASQYIVLRGDYLINFNYYGESYEFNCSISEQFNSYNMSKYTYVNVDSITTEGNIVFK